MKLRKFEAKIARAGFIEANRYEEEDGKSRRIYKSQRVPYRISIAVQHDEVDDWDALKVEVILDEEGYFE